MTTEKHPLLTAINFEPMSEEEEPPDPLPQLMRDAGVALGALGHYLCHNTARWRGAMLFLLLECVTGLAILLAVNEAMDVFVLHFFNATPAYVDEERRHDSLYGSRMGQLWMSLLLLLLLYAGAAIYRRCAPYQKNEEAM